jgi:hypothetical protein
MALASLATACALGALLLIGHTLQDGGLVALVAYLAASAFLGGATFFISAYLLRVHEIRNLWHQGTTWIRNL